MTRHELVVVVLMALLAILSGCSTSTDLTGTAVPNSRPDTRVSGQPPTLLEAGYSVEFNWTGGDPDGRIVGYQWKISDNGVDGISPRDTLTVDPVSGAVINPWNYTTANDSLFYVLADQAGFEGDPEGFERSFRTHTFFVRAVDDKGAVDPSPAMITFTSTTIVPTCQAKFTEASNTFQVLSVPSTVNLSYDGADEDYELGTPTHVRFLLTPAQYEDEAGNLQNISSQYYYNLYGRELIDFEDPEWSDWQRFGATDEDRKISYPDQPDANFFLFAVQVRDTAGAVSIGKDYGNEVLNLRISANQFFPTLNLSEAFLGFTTQQQSSSIPAGQPLNFSWTADATSGYNGEIVSMRHGWDLADVEDANDPGWAVPPGLTEQNRFAEERSFANGEHSFWVRVEDDSGAVTVVRWNISITPFVSRDNQLNLLLLDQVHDYQTGRWPNAAGGTALDLEDFRNAYWRFLDEVGGVGGFNWTRDFVDHRDAIGFTYEDLVKYKVALLFARSHSDQALFQNFLPEGPLDRFVWLTPYQEKGGNMFLVGSQSLESFLEVQYYMVPLLFDSPVDEYVLNNTTFIIGFGDKELNDGTEIRRGPLMYPYATAGITALDWSVPLNKWIFGRRNRANEDRRVVCSALKQIKLADDFRAHHNIGPGAISSVINTNAEIDWRDPLASAGLDTMLNNPEGFPFPGDEFVNGVIADVATPMIPQTCEEFGYNGLCIEPMFTGVARFDWLREQVWDYGDDGWPSSIYSNNELREICGDMALTTYVDEEGNQIPFGTARTTGQTYGFFSYKMVEDKPVQLADVYWGFDPYRFEHAETKKAIMWVLSEYLQLPVEAGVAR